MTSPCRCCARIRLIIAQQHVTTMVYIQLLLWQHQRLCLIARNCQRSTFATIILQAKDLPGLDDMTSCSMTAWVDGK